MRVMGAWIAAEFGVEDQSRSGLIALLHRVGMEYRTPKAISRKLVPGKQAAFIKVYESLLNQLTDDEAVVFADAPHPTDAVRPVGYTLVNAVQLPRAGSVAGLSRRCRLVTPVCRADPPPQRAP